MTFSPDIKNLISLLPELSVEVIDVAKLTKVATKTVFSSFKVDQDSIHRLKETLNSDLKLKITMNLSGEKLSKENVERVVQLYFDQLHFNLVHFDFRPSSFSGGSVLQWKPSKLTHSFDEKFLLGIKKLYSAYYSYDNARFEEALLDVGLIKASDTSETKKELVSVFLTHFSEARDEEVVLDFEKFKTTFNEIFKVFKKYKIKVPVDFAYLGAYLATMYLTLDEYKVPLNISQIYKLSKIAT